MFADFIKRQLEKKNPKHEDTPFLVCKDTHPYEPPEVFRKPATYSPFPAPDIAGSIKDILLHPLSSPAPDFFVPTRFQAMCPNCRTICESVEGSYSKDAFVYPERSAPMTHKQLLVEVKLTCRSCHIQWNDTYSVFLASRNIMTPEVSYAPPPYSRALPPEPPLKFMLPDEIDRYGSVYSEEENRAFKAFLQKFGEEMLKEGYPLPEVCQPPRPRGSGLSLAGS